MILVFDGHRVVLTVLVADRFAGREVEELCADVDGLRSCLVLLDLHDVANGSLYVEGLNVLLEATILNLSVSQDVLYV